MANKRFLAVSFGVIGGTVAAVVLALPSSSANDPGLFGGAVDPRTHLVDPAKFPERIKVATGPKAGEFGWVDSSMRLISGRGVTGYDGPFSVYDTAVGGSIIGQYSHSSGFTPQGSVPSKTSSHTQTTTG
jgi:hypothetical protein